MKKICTFFGHRIAPSYLYTHIKQHAELLIVNSEVDCFWVGGCGDFDRLASQAIRDLKIKYPNVSLYLILAYLPMQNASKISYLKRLYDDLIYPEGLEFVPRRFAIVKRNYWMAENCDYAICYVSDFHGGAFKSMNYARHHHKNIINLTQKIS